MNGPNNKLDERQQKILNGAMAIGGIIAYIFTIGLIVYKLIKKMSFESYVVDIYVVGFMLISSILYYLSQGSPYPREKKSRKEKIFTPLDERQRDRITTSFAVAGFVAIFSNFLVIIFKLLTTRSLETSYSEITLILLMAISLIAYNLWNKEYDLPKTMTGKVIPIANSKEAKRERLGFYIRDALRFSIFFLVIDILAPERLLSFSTIDSITLTYALNFLMRFILFLILNSLWGEFNIKKHKNFIHSLEDESEK